MYQFVLCDFQFNPFASSVLLCQPLISNGDNIFPFSSLLFFSPLWFFLFPFFFIYLLRPLHALDGGFMFWVHCTSEHP